MKKYKLASGKGNQDVHRGRGDAPGRRRKATLDAPVRRYVRELVLADERAAGQITVLAPQNHRPHSSQLHQGVGKLLG